MSACLQTRRSAPFGVSANLRRREQAMKDFSMYACALKVVGGTSINLGSVALVSRLEFQERPTFLFNAQLPCLEYVSLLIENAVLLRTHRAGRVYAGFQRLSSMEPFVDLYMRISDISERVYVVGEADWQPPRHPNMRVITADPGTSMTRERFLIANSPALHAAFVGIERGDSYAVVKTSEEKMISRLADAAEDLIDDALTAHSGS